MATLGSTSHVSDTAEGTEGATNSQIATNLTMPTGGGTVTHVAAWFAGRNGSCSSRTCLWNSSYTLIDDSATFTASSGGATTLGASDLYNKALGAPQAIASGASLRVGWCRTTDADGFQWDRNDGTGNTYKGDGLTGSMTSVSTDTARRPNVYLTYETAPLVYVRRSSAWVQVDAVYVRRSSAWDDVGLEVYVRRSSAWSKAD